MTGRVWGAALTAAVFVGCAADDGRVHRDPGVDTRLDEATQAAPPCPSVAATLRDHQLAGRATLTYVPFFIFKIPQFYAARPDGSTAPQEYLGGDENQRVTLYTANDSATLWTANSANCVDTPICGDGVRNVTSHGNESCEGSDLGGKTCQSLGFTGGGTLRCTRELCTFDTSGCRSACGNGVLEGDELCDGTLLRETSCAVVEPFEYIGGTLKCGNACANYDESGCIRPTCGDGKIEGTEQCDGSVFPGPRTCIEYSGAFQSGNLKCSSGCGIDTSDCVGRCGNGALDPGESCDGTRFAAEFAGGQCSTQKFPWPVIPWNVTLNYVSGRLGCDNNCRLQESACQPAPGCYAINGKVPTVKCY